MHLNSHGCEVIIKMKQTEHYDFWANGYTIGYFAYIQQQFLIQTVDIFVI